MSLDNNAKTCVVCHAYLFDEDDIVYCPVCGAPHHRECYNSIGHCGLDMLHGTDKQYDLLKTETEPEKKPAIFNETPQERTENKVRCSVCGEEHDSSLRSCPKCGAPNFGAPKGFTPFDIMGGVPENEDLGDGITANDEKRFVLANTQRYLPKFRNMKNGKKFSWNWLAFFFPCGWFLSRKMYKNGILVGLLNVAFSLLQIPLNKAVYSMGISDITDMREMADAFVAAMPKINGGIIAVAAIGLLLTLGLRIFCAVKGDYIYYKHSLSCIKKIKDESEDVDSDMSRMGGVNFFAMVIGVFGIDFLIQFLTMFV